MDSLFHGLPSPLNDEMLAVLQISLQQNHLAARMSRFQGSGRAQQQKLLGSDFVLLVSVPLSSPRTGSTWGWKRLPSEQPLGLLTCGTGTMQCFLLASTLRHRLLMDEVSLSHDKNKSQITCWGLFSAEEPT